MKYIGFVKLDEMIEWLRENDVELINITGGHDGWIVLYK